MANIIFMHKSVIVCNIDIIDIHIDLDIYILRQIVGDKSQGTNLTCEKSLN